MRHGRQPQVCYQQCSSSLRNREESACLIVSSLVELSFSSRRCANAQDENGVWNHFTGKADWGPWAITRDSGYAGTGEASTGEVFHAAPNIDHSNETVRNDIREVGDSRAHIYF